MTQKKVKLADATGPEIRDFASSVLGIEIHPNTPIERARAKVAAALGDKDEITVEIREPEPAIQGSAPRPVTAKQQPPARKMVRIRVNRTEDVGGNEAVPVAVNGQTMLIPRDKDVDVPEEYVEALEHATKHVFDMMPDGHSINPEPRVVSRFPFQRVA